MMLLPSLLILLPRGDGMVALLRLAMGAWTNRRDHCGDGETQCSKVRSDEVQDGASLRSQAVAPRCVFAPRVSRMAYPPPLIHFH